MKYRFTAEDFVDSDSPVKDSLTRSDKILAENMALFAAEKANTLLEQWENESMAIFARHNDLSFWHSGPDDGELCGQETHEAIVWNPRKIGEK